MEAPLTTTTLIKEKPAIKKSKLAIDYNAIAQLGLVGVAYSHVERDMFPTKDAYDAEIEVVERANEIIEILQKAGIKTKGYPADEYFLATLMIDKPDLIINLVDTFKGLDRLSTSIPAALELLGIEYTGAGMQGFLLGSNRQFTKQILEKYKIPTPAYQFFRRNGAAIQPDLGLPLIVKLNESGGSVGINKDAVKETADEAKKQVETMLSTYKMPVIVEKFIDGSEVTAIVFDDGVKKHVFLGEKTFNGKIDGRHEFTPIEGYQDDTYEYKKHTKYAAKITRYATQAFSVLHHKDYGKFDIRVDEKNHVPYFIDSNPNTAFGPSIGLPIADIVSRYGISFEEMLMSLISKHARQIINIRNNDTTKA